jgi:molybdopterin molybdotransferase
VVILATGDEIIAPEQELLPGRVRDINSYTVGGLVAKAGGLPDVRGIVPDELTAMHKAAQEGLAAGDMLVVTAGSSVSNRDMTAKVVAALGEPGVLLHGIATRPGKPTIVAVAGGKPVFGLPGNPVSAMIQFDMLGVPALYRLQGMAASPPRTVVRARLNQNLPSASGREDYVPAQLDEVEDGWVARPVFGKSNLIYTLVKADGLIKVPLNRAGIPAGEWVEVVLF